MRMVHDFALQVQRIAFQILARVRRTPGSIHCQLPVAKRDHFFSALACEIEHVIDRIGKEELSGTPAINVKFDPEHLIASVSPPIAPHKVGITIKRFPRPASDTLSGVIEQVELTRQVRLACLPVAVRTCPNNDMRTARVVEKMADFYLLAMFGSFLP